MPFWLIVSSRQDDELIKMPGALLVLVVVVSITAADFGIVYPVKYDRTRDGEPPCLVQSRTRREKRVHTPTQTPPFWVQTNNKTKPMQRNMDPRSHRKVVVKTQINDGAHSSTPLVCMDPANTNCTTKHHRHSLTLDQPATQTSGARAKVRAKTKTFVCQGQRHAPEIPLSSFFPRYLPPIRHHHHHMS